MRLVHGEPIVFGAEKEKCVVRAPDGHLQVALVADVDPAAILIHDAHAEDPGLAFGLSRLSDAHTLSNTPIGVFRDVAKPSYDRLVREQVEAAAANGAGDLGQLLRGSDTWTIT